MYQDVRSRNNRSRWIANIREGDIPFRAKGLSPVIVVIRINVR